MNIYQQIALNKRRTYVVVAFFIAFIAFIAYVFGEANGYGLSYAGIALIVSGLISFAGFRRNLNKMRTFSLSRNAEKVGA